MPREKVCTTTETPTQTVRRWSSARMRSSVGSAASRDSSRLTRRSTIVDGGGDAAGGQLREFAIEAQGNLVEQFARTFLWHANNVAARYRQRQFGVRHKT